MRTVPTALATHLTSDATTMADCLLMTRRDATVFAFTSLDVDLPVGAVTYKTAPGVFAAAIASRAGMEVDNTEVTALFSEAGVTLEDINSGDWDHAAFRLFRVNWADTTMGELKVLKGTLGQITTHNHLVTELRGMAAALQTTIGRLVSPGCPHEFGGVDCGKDLTDYTTTGEVTAVASNRAFSTDLATSSVRLTPSTTGAPTVGYFESGVLTWLTGANAGRREVVKYYFATGAVELQLPMFSPVSPTDTFSVHAGCQKSREADCRDRMDNLLRFGGYDLLPGQEVIMKWGGQ